MDGAVKSPVFPERDATMLNVGAQCGLLPPPALPLSPRSPPNKKVNGPASVSEEATGGVVAARPGVGLPPASWIQLL